MSWGINETAPEIEKIKSESADYLNGLNSCGVIDWNTYNYAFDFYADLLMKAYEQGRKDAQPEPCDDPRADVYYLAEKIGIHRLYALVVELRGEPEPCEDAVSRKAVYEAMIEKGQRSRRYRLGETWELNGAEIRETLDTVPSVTPKRKTGRWLDNYQYGYKCSECGAYLEIDCGDVEMNFCPNCNADMRGKQDE